MRDRGQETSVIFVRHGTPAYPEDQLYGAGEGPGLAAEGLGQAEALARWLKGASLAGLSVSPTRRTRETAAPLAAATGLRPVEVKELRERGFGAWDGLAFDEVERLDPSGYRAWKTDPVAFRPPGGESIADLQARVVASVHGLLAHHPGGVIAVVTHVGPIRVAVAAALEMPLRDYRRLTISPGSATRVNYGTAPTAQPNLAYLGVRPFQTEP